MSLADELLADLEDIDGEEDEGDWGEAAAGQDGSEDDMDENPDKSEGVFDDPTAFDQPLDHHSITITAIAKLHDSKKFQNTLKKIDQFQEVFRTEILGAVENDPEYTLIVDANNIIVEIDNEIGAIHKFVRDLYQKRFPELENLVLSPLEFFHAVTILKNEMDTSKVDLTEVLAPATIMVVSVTASTTKGEALSEDELARVLEACAMGIALNDAKNKIFRYVESRMFLFAPNLTQICGANTAAKLMGTAGGLTALSRIPACNILVLGASKKAMAGFSMAATLPHTGFIYYCELVQRQAPDYRRKCAKLIAAKCALAARIDSFHDKNTKSAELGSQFREYIMHNLEKAQEPPPAKLEKALARPDIIHGKKRAGKRVKKMRDRIAQTKVRSAADRMSFGRIEEDILQDEIGFSTGRVGEDSGQVRSAQSTQRKLSVSKKLQKELNKTPIHGGLSTIRGMSSSTSAGTASVVFTPFQGIEINNPQAAEKKVAEANAKYFGKSGFDFANKRPKAS